MPIESGKFSLNVVDEIDTADKDVFVRVDFNVPIEGEKVTDDTRIRAALPTIDHLRNNGARLILASHLGRPKGQPNPKYSLMPVAERLAELLNVEVHFPDDCIGDGVRKVLRDRNPKDVVLLENLRFHEEEEKNDRRFAEALQNGATVYVTDAFGSLHRAHASTFALPRRFETKAAGFLVRDELKFLTPLLKGPLRPYAVVLGGVKVSDKIGVLEKLVQKVDLIFFGGAMVFTFLKAMGYSVGKSLVEEDKVAFAGRFIESAKAKGVKLFFPVDIQVGNSIDDPGPARVVSVKEIPADAMGLDIGPKSAEMYAEELLKAKTVFWNGPMGLFEKPPFDRGTLDIAQALAGGSGTRVIGGGDSVAAVQRAGVAEKMTHISTGGGATLEFLEGKSLPGLESLSV